MSEEQPPAASELSFERAEFEGQATPALACAFCNQPLTGQYWQISTRAACAGCRASIAQQLDLSQSSASLLRASVYGVLAALAGSITWIAIEKLFHIQIGIVAIGVGYLVGKAVRKGSGGLGGKRYQVLAIALTYAAIALASLPDLMQAVAQRSAAEDSAASGPPSVSAFIWGCALLLGVALASPFLQGTENLIGLFIIGIGLYEAWKFTRPVAVQVLGPFSAAAPASPPTALGAHAAD
ncbi:MAG TPA: hypothetical protein VJV79_05750 [Polyangiaceae bacterium]|nr:hypothetical protein [Polyangiaceae bacterium]